MEFAHFAPSQRLTKSASRAVLGTKMWCDQQNAAAEAAIEAAQAEAQTLVQAARAEAEGTLKEAGKTAAARVKKAIAAERREMRAQAALDAEALAEALSAVERDLVHLLEQSLFQLFDIVPKAELLTGIVRRVISTHGTLNHAHFRVSAEYRPVLEKALEDAGLAASDVSVNTDLSLQGDACVLVAPGGTVDVAPRAQAKVMLNTLMNGQRNDGY